VTFDIDANGIVAVQAKDKATGKETQIRIQASGGLSDVDIERMVRDAEENSAADKVRREAVESRNHAEGLINQLEKTLKESEGKVPPADQAEAEAAIAETKSALDGGTVEAVKAATDKLTQVSMKIGEALYKSQAEAGPAAEAGPTDEKVVDADFEDVDDKNKSA
jgi:molecular chaperone DnaK